MRKILCAIGWRTCCCGSLFFISVNIIRDWKRIVNLYWSKESTLDAFWFAWASMDWVDWARMFAFV